MCLAVYGTINNPFVGADAHIGPPGLAQISLSSVGPNASVRPFS